MQLEKPGSSGNVVLPRLRAPLAEAEAMTAQRDALISERELAATVDAMAERFGWKIYGVLEQRVYARRLSKGFPDRVMTRNSRLLFIEYKSQRGRVTPEQQEWLELLRLTLAEVFLWRPSDLDRIEEILR